MEKQQNFDNNNMQYGNQQPEVPPYSPTDPQSMVQQQPVDYPTTSTTNPPMAPPPQQQYDYQPMPVAQAHFVAQQQQQVVVQQPQQQQVMVQQPRSTAVYSIHPQVPQQAYNPPQHVIYQQTVVSNQPTSMAVGGGRLRDWSTGMCDCCEDMHSCCCVTFFPHCFACGLAQRMNESCCVTCAVPGGLIAMRSAFRTRHGIQGDICGDCCDFLWCGMCVMCQMSREMDKMGYAKTNCC